MALTPQDVRHVALLSRLELGDADIERNAEELSKIFAFIEQLNGLDTEGVPPTTHALPMSNVFRADEVRPSLSPGEALANAPRQAANCFKVPQII
ncbi:MAG: Asp-tRNA(Asn)/Glu-tRNA(Gln) amidotransferase subunit GatC [Candidatus Sumerlaeia bacterium]|nr:Asp-tRNA(Asn)/Glu-tRNA(Gln) amidotransferase subunit GatC [Candidatus Sumerlaeia bacterium]